MHATEATFRISNSLFTFTYSAGNSNNILLDLPHRRLIAYIDYLILLPVPITVAARNRSKPISSTVVSRTHLVLTSVHGKRPVK
jgi:hypothetical protein